MAFVAPSLSTLPTLAPFFHTLQSHSCLQVFAFDSFLCLECSSLSSLLSLLTYCVQVFAQCLS